MFTYLILFVSSNLLITKKLLRIGKRKVFSFKAILWIIWFYSFFNLFFLKLKCSNQFFLNILNNNYNSINFNKINNYSSPFVFMQDALPLRYTKRCRYDTVTVTLSLPFFVYHLFILVISLELDKGWNE